MSEKQVQNNDNVSKDEEYLNTPNTKNTMNAKKKDFKESSKHIIKSEKALNFNIKNIINKGTNTKITKCNITSNSGISSSNSLKNLNKFEVIVSNKNKASIRDAKKETSNILENNINESLKESNNAIININSNCDLSNSNKNNIISSKTKILLSLIDNKEKKAVTVSNKNNRNSIKSKTISSSKNINSNNNNIFVMNKRNNEDDLNTVKTKSINTLSISYKDYKANMTLPRVIEEDENEKENNNSNNIDSCSAANNIINKTISKITKVKIKESSLPEESRVNKSLNKTSCFSSSNKSDKTNSNCKNNDLINLNLINNNKTSIKIVNSTGSTSVSSLSNSKSKRKLVTKIGNNLEINTNKASIIENANISISANTNASNNNNNNIEIYYQVYTVSKLSFINHNNYIIVLDTQ